MTSIWKRGMDVENAASTITAFTGELVPRFRGDEFLTHDRRRRIYEDIRAHPGETYADLKRNLILSNGALTHHLDVLERESLIRSSVRDGRKMFWLSNVLVPTGTSDARQQAQDGMLRALAENPAASISDVAVRLGISRQLATYRARLLARQGLVNLERRENRLCAVPVHSVKLSDAGALPGYRQATATTRAGHSMAAPLPPGSPDGVTALLDRGENDAGEGFGSEVLQESRGAGIRSPKRVRAHWRPGTARQDPESLEDGDGAPG